METKLIQAFNKQINHEFYSAYLYFAMSTYFDEIAMNGFSKFMKHKASEKLDCAQKIYDYIILRDEKLTFSKIEEPSVDWINVSDIFSRIIVQGSNIPIGIVTAVIGAPFFLYVFISSNNMKGM